MVLWAFFMIQAIWLLCGNFCLLEIQYELSEGVEMEHYFVILVRFWWVKSISNSFCAFHVQLIGKWTNTCSAEIPKKQAARKRR